MQQAVRNLHQAADSCLKQQSAVLRQPYQQQCAKCQNSICRIMCWRVTPCSTTCQQAQQHAVRSVYVLSSVSCKLRVCRQRDGASLSGAAASNPFIIPADEDIFRLQVCLAGRMQLADMHLSCPSSSGDATAASSVHNDMRSFAVASAQATNSNADVADAAIASIPTGVKYRWPGRCRSMGMLAMGRVQYPLTGGVCARVQCATVQLPVGLML
jgi:hypothetical protein